LNDFGEKFAEMGVQKYGKRGDDHIKKSVFLQITM